MRYFEWLTPPTSYQNAHGPGGYDVNSNNVFFGQKAVSAITAHSGHPNFGHLILLVFEAVLEVVCVSLPGYIVARQGMFDAEAQKFLANLNVMLFTPCLSKSTENEIVRHVANATFSFYQTCLPIDSG